MDQFPHPNFAFNQPQSPAQQYHQQPNPFPAQNNAYAQQQQQPPFQQGSHAGNFGGYGSVRPQMMQQQGIPGEWYNALLHITRQLTSSAGQQQQFTSAPSSTPASAPQSTDTPTQHVSPYGNQSQNPQQTPTPNPPKQKQQMASPATSQAPGQAQPVTAGGPGSPLPQDVIEKEQARVTLLLEINQVILHELINMQKQGKGGNVQPSKNPETATEEEKKVPTAEYVEYVSSPIAASMRSMVRDLAKKQNGAKWNSYMRSMQANLAYLAADAERHHKQQKMLPGPAVMIPPHGGSNQELAKLYIKLQGMFPGWKGNYRPNPNTSARTSQSPVATTSSAPNSQANASKEAGGDGNGQGKTAG